MAIENGGSLRETIEAVVSDKEAEIAGSAGVDNAVIPAAEVPASAEATIPGAPEAKADDRPRGPDGKFVEKKAEPKEPAAQAGAKATTAKAPPVSPTSAPKAPAQSASPAAAAPPVPSVQRPSTWKKEHWAAYDKLAAENPALAQYILQREGEFASGVSTYKQSWETAKPLIDALAPYQPLLQQYNIQPGPWVAALAENHRILALGTPEQKAAKFAQLAREYQIPIESLFVQGQDGRLYVNQQLAAHQPAPQQQGLRPEDVERVIDQRLQGREVEAATQAFAAQRDRYPHYEAVKQTMAGILQAGLAEGESLPEMLDSAYEAALRHPRHAEIFNAMQEQQRAEAAAKEAEEKRKAAMSARSKAASPRSASPTAPANAGQGKSSLRGTIEEAFDARVGGRL